MSKAKLELYLLIVPKDHHEIGIGFARSSRDGADRLKD